MRLDGARVVVTGGASGIGAALARRFVREGVAALRLVDLDGAGAAALAAELSERSVAVDAVTVDVGERDEVHRMVADAEAELGGIDLLCSNAGVAIGEGLDASPQDWDRAWRVNVLAQVHAAQAAIPGMLTRGGGHLLHTASAAALLTTPGDAPYTATKHASLGFAEWLAVTYGDRGIGVSCLCPQAVDTPMLMDGVARGNASAIAVRDASQVLSPDAVADAAVAALVEDRFLVLPHPEVARYAAFKGADRDGWIAALRRQLAR